MTLLGRDVLMKAGKRNKPLKAWLDEWIVVVEESEWQSIEDVHRAYPSADGVTLASKTVVTVFNVKGNMWRLLAWIDYESQIVEALEILTHAEYSKNMWKRRY